MNLRRLAAVVVAAAAALAAGPSSASAASTCAAQSLAVTALQSSVFYIDVDQSYLGSYVGYKLTNSGGTAKSGLWLQLENFTGGVLKPGDGTTATAPLSLGGLGGGGATAAYAYLTAASATTTAQGFDVVVYSGRPGSGGSEVCRETQAVAAVEDVIKAAANKVDGATLSSASATLGSTFNLTVTGHTGTIGAGTAADPGVVRFSPAVAAAWPSRAFRLVSVSHKLPSSGGAIADVLSRSGLNGSPDTAYSVTYTFRVVGPTTTTTPVNPVQNIASGTQVKHTDPGTLSSLAPIPVVTSSATMAVAPVSPGPYRTGDQVPLTATVTNNGTGAVALDELALKLPSGWEPVPGTATQDGATIDDPYTSGNDHKLVGPYTVPGSSTSTFRITATPTTSGTGTFSAAGVLAGGQVDSTTNVNDDAPATTTLTVLGSPVAEDDHLGAKPNETTDLDVLANDTVGGGTTTLTIVDDPGFGTASVVDGKLRYTPNEDYEGPDSIGYRIANEVEADTAIAYIEVSDAPAPPAPSPLTSTGVGTAVQHRTIPLAAGQTVRWTGTDPRTVTRSEGTYVLDADSGAITFTPVLGWSGTAAALSFEITDGLGRTGQSTFTASVTKPAGPSASPLTSTGIAPAAQHTTVAVPAHASVGLLDAQSDPATSVTVTGKGTFVLDTDTGKITFTPVSGYRGSTATVAYRLSDAYGTTAEATYTPTVDAPGAPDAPAKTSTGVGVTPQTSTLPAPPANGSVTLLDGQGHPALSVTIPSQGTYELDATTRVVTFRAVLGFKGTPTAVAYRVSDAYGQHSDGTYTPSVTAPAAPPAEQQATSAPAGTDQATVIPVPAGGSVTLLDAQGHPTNELVIAGVGRYRIASGRITFTPEAGYAGTPPSVRYRIVDAYGQLTEAQYQPKVTASAAPAAAPAATPVAASPRATPVEPGCVSRRVMRIHFKAPRGAKLRNVTVAVTGARTRALASSARAFDVDLRGRGRELVRVTVTAKVGTRTVLGTRTYRPCRPRETGAPLKTLRLVAKR